MLAILKRLALLATVLLAALRFAHNWERSSWSNGVLRAAMSAPTATLGAPPADHPRATLWLASAAFESGQAREAIRLLESGGAPLDLLSLRLLGEALAAEGRLAPALAAWEQAGDYARLVAYGNDVLAEGQTGDAQLAYEAAHRLDAEQGTLPLARFHLNALKDNRKAEALLQQAIGRHVGSPLEPTWRRQLGRILRSEQRWDEAEAVYQAALLEGPAAWRFYIDLGWLYYERGDGSPAALAAFEQAIALRPEAGDGYFASGQLLVAEARYAEADAWFQMALLHDPDQKGWYITRANAARRNGSLALAVDVYHEAITRFPGYAPAYYELSEAHKLAGDEPEAFLAIEKAIALARPPDAHYYARAGEIYEWAGQPGRALEAYRVALAINPNHKAAARAVQRLVGE